MRNALWPDSLDNHIAEIEEFFAGNAVDIVETFIVERPDGKLAGFIELNTRSFADGSRSAHVPYVEAWYTDPDVRGKGVGTSRMEVAERWSLDQGFNGPESDAERTNKGEIAAHKTPGFTEVNRAVCLPKKLD